MRVVEEPFMTRGAILAVLRPGLSASEGPFRTMREHGTASAGLRVQLRGGLGHMLGQAHLYGSLNADAARAVRLGEPDLARELAAQAQEMERSSDAASIREAVEVAAARIAASPAERAPVAYRSYLRQRSRFSWGSVDERTMARDWIARSSAWLSEAEHDELRGAVAVLARLAEQARARIVCERLPPVHTFYGFVQRLDAFAAEVQGEREARLVPREELDRQGLATIGQPVALLCETLPAGGSLVLPMPAVALTPPVAAVARSPWDLVPRPEEQEGALISPIDAADQQWLARDLAREPTAVPLAPIRCG